MGGEAVNNVYRGSTNFSQWRGHYGAAFMAWFCGTSNHKPHTSNLSPFRVRFRVRTAERGRPYGRTHVAARSNAGCRTSERGWPEGRTRRIRMGGPQSACWRTRQVVERRTSMGKGSCGFYGKFFPGAARPGVKATEGDDVWAIGIFHCGAGVLPASGAGRFNPGSWPCTARPCTRRPRTPRPSSCPPPGSRTFGRARWRGRSSPSPPVPAAGAPAAGPMPPTP